ncbi:MAG: hypothetical protein AB8G77_14070 [Rhodothermales bacterium]
MWKSLLMVLVGTIVFTGCKSTSSAYEKDDLITIAHNRGSDYTLLVYRSTKGRTRKVLRRKGVCELLLIESDEGEFFLKERGQEPRKLPLTSVQAVEAHLDELIYNKSPGEAALPLEGDTL